MPTRGWTPTDTPTDTQASETTNQLSDELFNDNTADNSQGTSMASTTGVTEIARDEKIQGAKRKRVDVPRKRNPSFPPPKKLNQEQWDQMFDRLLEYKDHHGDCLVPKRYAADPKLGTWVETQRVQYKRLLRNASDLKPEDSNADEGAPLDAEYEEYVEDTEGNSNSNIAITPSRRLNAERLHRLESIGFAWTAKNTKRPAATSKSPARRRYNETQWNEMYERLVKYKEKYGDCLVPKKFDEDPKLGTWVETQRVLHNRGYKKGTHITEDMVDAVMEDVAASIAAAGGSDALIDSSTAAVSAAVADAKPPEEWATDVAASVTAAGGSMTLADSSAAAVAAAVADAKSPEEWATEMENENEMEITKTEVEYTGSTSESESAPLVQLEPTSIGPATHPPSRGLNDKRKQQLDALGFVWSLRAKRVEDHWDQMFQQLCEYKTVHGDCLVPSRFEENMKLGKWVETQRYEYTKLQRTTAAQESKPEAIGESSTSHMAMPLNADPSQDDQEKSLRPVTVRLTEERLRRLKSINFEWKVKNKMKRYYDRQWDEMFQSLLKYKEENGSCLVPKRYPPDMKLGTWVHTQRIQYRKLVSGAGAASKYEGDEEQCEESETSFRLTDDRRKRLEDIGFVWSVRDKDTPVKQTPVTLTRNSYDDQWDVMFERLKKYKEEHQHCLVPKRCKEDPKLGTWVDTQRVQYKKLKRHLEKNGLSLNQDMHVKQPDDEGGTSADGSPEISPPAGKPLVGRLTDDRINRLESVGFVWSLRDDWTKHYEELKQFKQVMGHCNVPARYKENRRLGIWVSAQRQQYKAMRADEEKGEKRSTPLTEERIDLLNQLSFTWTIRSRDTLGESWNQRLEELKEYKRERGDCLVPSRYGPNPELGVWVGTQRTQYRLYLKAKELGVRYVDDKESPSAMNDERVAQLEELGFVWALRGTTDNLWRKRLGDLLKFKGATGHLNVSSKSKEYPRLSGWMTSQRVQYRLLKEGKPTNLDEEKVSALESIGFSWYLSEAGRFAAETAQQASETGGTEPMSSEGILSTAAMAAAIVPNSVTGGDNTVTQGETDPVSYVFSSSGGVDHLAALGSVDTETGAPDPLALYVAQVHEEATATLPPNVIQRESFTTDSVQQESMTSEV
eukprot:CAMPEP_0198283158 /NCGR_PEP_ID=MMETSP1449-20131203/2828_1 /TAXON_ID=420275 /ORGANISM="Attheya septentrionalis, Strain CCMP2084" /LENGTH=1129 /DNA_ID=CAMNT_0043979683 /DNA_START=92 /DNA_END=3481 /DNA_ORIENTATION=+